MIQRARQRIRSFGANGTRIQSDSFIVQLLSDLAYAH